MKSRQEKSCFELFFTALPTFNANLLKILSVTYLLLSQSSVASETEKVRFFSPRGTNKDAYYVGSCITASPGGFLIVKPIPNAYDVQHVVESSNEKKPQEYDLDLVEQLEKQTFIGDVFCFHKLESKKEARFTALKNKSHENSEYTIDFRFPQYIDIEVPKTKKPGGS